MPTHRATVPFCPCDRFSHSIECSKRTFILHFEPKIVSETITQDEQTETANDASKSPANGDQSIWQIDILPVAGNPDRLAEDILSDATDIGLPADLKIKAARTFLVQGNLLHEQAQQIADQLLVEPVVEKCVVAKVGSEVLSSVPDGFDRLINVMPLPGVTDPQAESAMLAIGNLGFDVSAVRTIKKYWISSLDDSNRESLIQKLLCNDSIETTVEGSLQLDRLDLGRIYEFKKTIVPLSELDDDSLVQISKEWQLSLSLTEMQTIKAHFASLDRDPVDVELETIAQTWSEHCSHKTLAGRINYRDETARSSLRTCSKRQSLQPPFRFAKTSAKTTGASVSSKTTLASSNSTIRTTLPSKSKLTIALPLWSPTVEPTPESAA